MKKPKTASVIIASIIILGLCSFAMGDTTITCPDGDTLSMEHIYTNLVPSDFPPELCTIFCTIPFSPAQMEKYPQVTMGLASISGTPQDQIIIVWFLDNITRKYIGFIEWNQIDNKYKVLWISEFAPDGFMKYVHSVIDEANNSESF